VAGERGRQPAMALDDDSASNETETVETPVAYLSCLDIIRKDEVGEDRYREPDQIRSVDQMRRLQCAGSPCTPSYSYLSTISSWFCYIDPQRRLPKEFPPNRAGETGSIS